MQGLSDTGLQFSLFQQRVLGIPEDFNLALLGGRGGGKLWAILGLIIRHIELYGTKANILVVRQTYGSLEEIEKAMAEVFFQVYRRNARYNQTDHRWKFGNGAQIKLGQLMNEEDYLKYQGHSFTLVIVDEAGQFGNPVMIDKLMSNMRGPKGIKTRIVLAANPGGPGHAWLAQRHVYTKTPEWDDYVVPATGKTFITAPSTYRDNPFIDQEEYRANLAASAPSDPALLRAWLDGDWSVLRGAFFSEVLDEKRTKVVGWTPEFVESLRDGGKLPMRLYLAYDHGRTDPAVCYVCAELTDTISGPDDEGVYPRGSVVLLDEWDSCQPGSLTDGMGYVVPQIAEEIKALAETWKMPARGVADDVICNQTGSGSGSIADEFRRCGVFFQKAKKGRREAGWEIMRRLMSDAGKPEKPGLYVSDRCGYWWATVPSCSRDPRRPDDVDGRGADHAADASRYACVAAAYKPEVYIGYGR